MIYLTTPLDKAILETLHVGDEVLLSGTIYTARDAAHKRIIEMLERNEKLPMPIKDQVIYYVGPTPKKENMIIGSAGPTTASRMDAYAPKLYDLGLAMSIGKGYRNQEVRNSIKENKAIYALAIGGLGALLSNCIKKSEVVAFHDLESEAIHKLEVENFPITIGIDTNGNDIYE